MKQLAKTKENYRSIAIKVAITGSTGNGKSSLINALRGLRCKDPGAAKVGYIETTLTSTRYLYPNNKNVELYDLPGDGSPNFPQDCYLQQVQFETYDFIIIVSSARFTTDDVWLANEISTRWKEAKLVFIRAKIDNDLENKEKERQYKLTDEEKQHEMKIIKDDICRNLEKNRRITDPCIFLVINYNVHGFEFRMFTEHITKQISTMKRNSLILSLNCHTKEIVPFKIKVLQGRIAEVSKLAAKSAVAARRQIYGTQTEFDI